MFETHYTNPERIKPLYVRLVLLGACALIPLFLFGCPRYIVYMAEQQGKAELAQAINGRRVQIEDARGKWEAATLLADAEVERAKGVAAANQIIGESLKNNEAYLRYLWISNLEKSEGKGSVIYVPTEAGLPILEAGKR